MLILRPPSPSTRTLAVFCGAFHPPTIAHVSLAQAAKIAADEVLWILPSHFPHKEYDSVSLPSRARLLLEATADPVAIADASLFFAIAQEASSAFSAARVVLLTGEDGARRIVEWNYPEPIQKPSYLSENLKRFPIYAARRNGSWQVPEEFAAAFHWLELSSEHETISSTEVRRRIAAGEDWQSITPQSIHQSVSRLYGSSGKVSGQ